MTLRDGVGTSYPGDPKGLIAIWKLQYGNTNKQFVMQFDGYNHLTKITYPGGGYTRYDYQEFDYDYPLQSDNDFPVGCTWGIARVKDRYECPSSSGSCNSENTTTNNWSSTYGPEAYTVDVTDPLGTRTEHTFDWYSDEDPQSWPSDKYVFDSSNTQVEHVNYGYTVGDGLLPSSTTTTIGSGSSAKTSSVQYQYDVRQITDTGPNALGNWGPNDTYGPYAVAIDNPTEIDEYGYDGSSFKKTANTYWYSGHILNDKLLTSTITDPASNFIAETTYTRDGVGNVESKTLSGTNATTQPITYTPLDAYGRPTQAVDGRYNTTQYDYADSWADSTCAPAQNSSAYLTKVTDADGEVTKYSYYSCTGLLAATTDPNNAITQYFYDPIGRLSKVIRPDTGTTTYTYNDTPQNYVQVTTEENSAESIVNKTLLDGYGRTSQTQLVSDPRGTDYVDTTYDAVGRVASVSNPYRAQDDSTYGVTYFNYDALDRKTEQIQQDGNKVWWCYNDIQDVLHPQPNCHSNGSTFTTGAWVDRADELGNDWEDVYDAAGNLRSAVEPYSFETDYTYDAFGDLLTANQNGASGDTPRSRTFTYTGLSQLITSANPETGTICYGTWSGSTCQNSYDADGNLGSKTDARGIQITYSYDNMNRLTWKHYSDGDSSVGFGYNGFDENGNQLNPPVDNAMGRLSHSSNEVNAAETYSYDPMGRVKEEWYCTPQDCSYDNKVQAAYDYVGNLVSLTYPDSRVVTHTFDAADRLSSIDYADWGQTTVDTNYLTVNSNDAPGHVTNATLNLQGGPLTVTSSYNPRLEIAALAYNTAPATVWSKQYTWTANGSLQEAVDAVNGITRKFTYDNLNRILSAQDVYTGTETQAPTGILENYSIDAFGNMKEEGSFNFMPSGGFNGSNQPLPNIDWQFEAAGNLTRDAYGNNYTWNAEEQISSSNGISYFYNAADDRVGKSGSAATDTIYFGGRPLARLSGSTWTDLIYESGDILAEVPGTQTGLPSYRLTNHLGSTVADLSAVTPLPAIQDYAPYGQLFNGSSTTDPFKFTGKERDSESGLDYFGARYYASSMGRFMSPDWSASPEAVPYSHLDNPQSLNLYGYVLNNPLSKPDLDGHGCPPDCSTGNPVVDFLGGFANAYGSDNLAGAGRVNQTTFSGQLGQALGDVTAAGQGVGEVIVGTGGNVVGVALDATGVGAVVGVPANFVSTAVTVHGAATATTALMKAGGNFSQGQKQAAKDAAGGKCQNCGVETTPWPEVTERRDSSGDSG